MSKRPQLGASSRQLRSRSWGLFLAIWIALWWLLVRIVPTAELQVDLVATAPGMAQLFFDSGSGYSEGESVSVPVKAGENLLSLPLPPRALQSLRFDPINSAATSMIRSFALREGVGARPQPLALDAWRPAGGTILQRDGEFMSVASADTDPQLQYFPASPLRSLTKLSAALHLAAIAALLAAGLCWLAQRWLTAKAPFPLAVRMMLGVATGVILALALIATTRASVHPDEHSHLEAFRYYLDNWLPPAVGDPRVVPSISASYGFSYLFELDVVYELAAKLVAPIAAFVRDDLLAGRLFNVGLWLCVVGLALRRGSWVWVASVALLSPQIWYVFAYFNADALPFVLTLVIAGLISEKDNDLHRYLTRQTGLNKTVLLCAAGLALLLLSKRNYLPVIPGFLLWLGVLHLDLRMRCIFTLILGLLALGCGVFLGGVPAFAATKSLLLALGLVLLVCGAGMVVWAAWREQASRGVLLRFAALAALCAALVMPRLAWDLWTNGTPSEKNAHVIAVADTYARADLRPSSLANGANGPGHSMAASGVKLVDVLFSPYNWAKSSAISAYGVYGYMNVFSANWLYVTLPLISLWIFVLAALALRSDGSDKGARLLVVAAGTVMLVGLSSLLHSWVDDFQAQGRYLLPCFAFGSLLLARAFSSTPPRFVATLVLIGGTLSAISFVCYAIPAFAR